LAKTITHPAVQLSAIAEHLVKSPAVYIFWKIQFRIQYNKNIMIHFDKLKI